MPQDVQITCVIKHDRSNPHERISAVGGVNPDGSRWRMSLDDAISSIEAGKYRFYTHGGGRSVWVLIATSAAGHKYLKTQDDGVFPDNLLALATCPLS